MESKESIVITQFSKYKIMIRYLFYIKHTKNVEFLSGSRGPRGPDLPSPSRRKFQFCFFTLMLTLMLTMKQADV